MPALKSSLFAKSNDLWGYCSELVKKILGPHNPTPNTAFGNITRNTPFPAEGVHGENETSSNELQRLFTRSRKSFSRGYTSHDFITVGNTCAITTALQPPTSIYRGLLAVPKVESTLPLNPHSMISTDLSVGVPAGTHTPAVPRSILDAFYHHSNHRIQSADSHLLIRYDHLANLNSNFPMIDDITWQ